MCASNVNHWFLLEWEEYSQFLESYHSRKENMGNSALLRAVLSLATCGCVPDCNACIVYIYVVLMYYICICFVVAWSSTREHHHNRIFTVQLTTRCCFVFAYVRCETSETSTLVYATLYARISVTGFHGNTNSSTSRIDGYYKTDERISCSPLWAPHNLLSVV